MTGPEQYPGEPTAEAVVEDDQHVVVLDLSDLAFPLDGIVPTLLRTIADEGLMSAALPLAHNRSSSVIARDSMFALQNRRAIAQVLQITLTPQQARALRDQLDAAQVERPKCRRLGCTFYAADAEHCAGHIEEAA